MARRMPALLASLALVALVATPALARNPNAVNAFAARVLQSDATDSSLVNGWGIVSGPTTPWWVSDNGTDLSTLYNGTTGAKVPAHRRACPASRRASSSTPVPRSLSRPAAPPHRGSSSRPSPGPSRAGQAARRRPSARPPRRGPVHGPRHRHRQRRTVPVRRRLRQRRASTSTTAPSPSRTGPARSPTPGSPPTTRRSGSRTSTARSTSPTRSAATTATRSTAKAWASSAPSAPTARSRVGWRRAARSTRRGASRGRPRAGAGSPGTCSSATSATAGSTPIARRPPAGRLAGTSQANHHPLVIDGLWGISFGNDAAQQRLVLDAVLRRRAGRRDRRRVRGDHRRALTGTGVGRARARAAPHAPRRRWRGTHCARDGRRTIRGAMPAPASSPAFVGRDADVDVLAGAFEASARGAPRFVVVRGEAGIGKTRLVREATDRRRRRWRACSAGRMPRHRARGPPVSPARGSPARAGTAGRRGSPRGGGRARPPRAGGDRPGARPRRRRGHPRPGAAAVRPRPGAPVRAGPRPPAGPRRRWSRRSSSWRTCTGSTARPATC